MLYPRRIGEMGDLSGWEQESLGYRNAQLFVICSQIQGDIVRGMISADVTKFSGAMEMQSVLQTGVVSKESP